MFYNSLITFFIIAFAIGCNDSNLAESARSTGQNGANGLSSVIATEAQPPGSNCPHGGTKLLTGLDDNGDGALAPDEVDSTAYICNGEPGPSGGPQGAVGERGPQGDRGATGEQGATGQAGADGYSSLAISTQEAPGTNCPNGGVRLQTGLDLNSDGLLGVTEITSVSFVCNGLDGADGANGTDGTNGADGSNGGNDSGGGNNNNGESTGSSGVMAGDIITVRKKARTFRYSSISDYNEQQNALHDPADTSEDAYVWPYDDAPVIEYPGEYLNGVSPLIGLANEVLTIRCPEGYMAHSAQCRGFITYHQFKKKPSTNDAMLCRSGTRVSHYGGQFIYPEVTTTTGWQFDDAHGVTLFYDSEDIFNGVAGHIGNGAAQQIQFTGKAAYPTGFLCSTPRSRREQDSYSGFVEFINVPGFVVPISEKLGCQSYGPSYPYAQIHIAGIGFNIDSQLTCLRVENINE